MNVHAPLLQGLAVSRNTTNKTSASELLVLKEDLAGLYDTSWELFVQGSSARKAEMSDQSSSSALLCTTPC